MAGERSSFQRGQLVYLVVFTLMSYSTLTSTAFNATNFGAKGDWLTDDTVALQTALNAAAQAGAGTLSLPKGNYLTSGYLHLSGALFNGVALVAEEGAWLRTAPSGDFRKLNISGASGVSILNLNVDAGRTVGRTSVYTGTIQLYNAPSFSIQDSYVANSEGLLLHIRGTSSDARITRNVFENFHIAIFGDGNDISGDTYHRSIITDNIFRNSWGLAGGENFFGGVKLQSAGFQAGLPNVPSRGHIISNNTFSNTCQMGVELWGFINDTTVSANTFERTEYGISIAHESKDITVVGNTVRAASYIGIEVADAYGVTVSSNTVNGATGLGTGDKPYVTSYGIIVNGVNNRPNNVTVVGNSVRNCQTNVAAYSTDQVIFVGNELINSGTVKGGTSFANQNSNHILFSDNSIHYLTSGTYFCFLDGSNGGSSGVTISNNDFNGIVSDWGIIYYNPSNTGVGNTCYLIENNRTYNVQSCGYGMINTSDYPPQYALHRNNFGPSGGGYSIPDYQNPPGASPYGTTNIAAGIQYYGNIAYTIPTGGVSGTAPNIASGIWLCVWSGGGGVQNDVRVRAFYYNNLGNNSAANMEVWTSMQSYPVGDHAIMVMPQGRYTLNSISQIRTQSEWQSWGATNSIWMKLDPIWSGAVGNQIAFYSTQANNLGRVYSTYTEPIWDTYSAVVYPNDNLGTLKTTKGITIGTGVSLLTSNGSDLTIAASGQVSIPNLSLPNNSYVTTAGNQSVNGIKAFNSGTFSGRVGVGGNFAPDTSTWLDVVGSDQALWVREQAGGGYLFAGFSQGNNYARIGAYNGGWRPLILQEGGGNVGLGTLSPNTKLHVNGGLTLSGITTSATANVGGVAIPATVAGFVTINITGGNFKVPYFNI